MLSKLVQTGLPVIAGAVSKGCGLALSTIALKSMGNSQLFKQLATGKVKLAMHSVDAVLVFCSANWPKGSEWPDKLGLPRPSNAACVKFMAERAKATKAKSRKKRR